MSRAAYCFIFLIFLGRISFLTGGGHPVILIVGTRPEVIKMYPVYEALKKEGIFTLICSTGQHAELLQGALDLFELSPDVDLKIMKPGQDLFYITTAVLEKAKELFIRLEPSMVVVQGDTTSAMAAALAAFYLKIPVAHVEAGLRTGNKYSPFPEELNRCMISTLASYHFAPTLLAKNHLLAEGIKEEKIFYTGNTVVDALLEIQQRIKTGKLQPSPFLEKLVSDRKKKGDTIVLLTAHRRESFEGGLQNIFSAVKEALCANPNLFIIYPRHPNPTILKIIEEAQLGLIPNLALLSPLDYHDLVYLLSSVDGIATDSGGVQEEGISLDKPVLVLRNETDRPEGVIAGKAVLVGTQKEKVLKELNFLMGNKRLSCQGESVYGDGHAGEKIAKLIKEALK